MPIVPGIRPGLPLGRYSVTASFRAGSVAEAAQLLADWRAELGYLQLADAVQMLTDAYGDRFVSPSASGHGCVRCDVLAALKTLAPATEWIGQVDCWEL